VRSSRFDRVTSVPAGRPVPDAADLRLLVELARSGSIGLPQAAWQAGMMQVEAATRMVAMAEAGLPLRLVAEGDRSLLWQIVQRGPAPFPAMNVVGNAGHTVPFGDAAQLPAVSGSPDAPGAAAFSAESVWGIPGTASWTSRADQPAGAPVPPPTARATESAAVAQSALATAQADPTEVAPITAGPPVGRSQRTVGLSGEQLSVTVLQVIDPGNDILTSAGYRLDDGERAVLVHTALANAGPAEHDCMPDLYLFLVDAAGRTLPKAPVAVAGHPAHRVGVLSGAQADGWTIFLIDAATGLTGVRWSVRPDLIDRTLTWSL